MLATQVRVIPVWFVDHHFRVVKRDPEAVVRPEGTLLLAKVPTLFAMFKLAMSSGAR